MKYLLVLLLFVSCERAGRLDEINDELDSLSIEIEKQRQIFDKSKNFDDRFEAWSKQGDIISRKIKLINEADSLLGQ